MRHLRRRHTLWLHGWLMGLVTLGVMWGAAALQRHAGVDSLALRYAVTLGVGYLCYLLLLRIWAGMLVREEERSIDDRGIDVWWPDGSGAPQDGGLHSGGGGDFGGGGADAGFDAPLDAVGDAGGSLPGDAASGALDGLGAADEGAIVIIPVLAVFGAVLAALFGAGWLLLLYFGSEALLAAAVELAFAYTAARTVVRVEREGWLLAAIRLSWVGGFGAAGGEEDVVQPGGREGLQLVGQLERQRMAELESGRIVELRGLLAYRFGNLASAMAEPRAPQAREAVEHLAPIAVGEVGALRRHDHARVALELAVGGEGHPELVEIVVFIEHFYDLPKTLAANKVIVAFGSGRNGAVYV